MKDIFNASEKLIIGMVHCLPLPGTPSFDGDFDKILNRAISDARTLQKAGVNAIIVENMGDSPFAAKMDIEQVTALTAAATLVKKEINIPLGIDAAFNDCKASIAIAAITKADFIRVPVFIDTVIFSDGIVYPCARECMKFRKEMGVENIKIFADIQVKHTYMLSKEISIIDSAKTAKSNGADAVIVTGSVTGSKAPIQMIEEVKKAIDIPVIAGSGVNKDNIKEQMKIADGAIIGSSLKEGGILTNPISYDLVKSVLQNL